MQHPQDNEYTCVRIPFHASTPAQLIRISKSYWQQETAIHVWILLRWHPGRILIWKKIWKLIDDTENVKGVYKLKKDGI